MSAIGSAFPVLTRRTGQNVVAGTAALATRLCAVTQAGLPQLCTQLQEIAHVPFTLNEEGMLCTLSVGPDISVPLTIIGTCETCGDDKYTGKDNIVVHSPGLPGGFVVQLQELLRCRARLSPQTNSGSPVTSSAQPSLGSVSLMEAVNAHLTTRLAPFADSATETPRRGILDAFYTRARRRHFSLAGMAELLHRGAQLHPDALRFDFPYQCGGAHAAKRYLDITPEVADVFGVEMRHGTKVLSRYGIAVSVGVVDRLVSVASPVMLWHPSGAPAACLAPLLHGCPLLPVGRVSLDYNGPAPGSPLTHKDDPRLYMKLVPQGCYDDSVWLTEGLFGVKPGDAWPPASTETAAVNSSATSLYTVMGVGYNEEAAEMELFVRDNGTDEVLAAADV